MSRHNMTLLGVTRWFVIATMALAVVVGLGIIAAGGAMLFAWPDVSAAIVKENAGIAIAELRPQFLGLFAFVLTAVGIALWSLRKLLDIVDSVRVGDPFNRLNAARLRLMGWLMVALQLVAIPIGALAVTIGRQFGEKNLDFDMSLNGILAILLVFVLAGVFEQGAAMREDLEGTI